MIVLFVKYPFEVNDSSLKIGSEESNGTVTFILIIRKQK